MTLLKCALSLALIAMLLACPACAITVEEARETVQANDPKAADAIDFWMYQSSETDGMWVVYATSIDRMFEGGAWFVAPGRTACLGNTRPFYGWEFYSPAPQPPVPDLDGRKSTLASLWPALYVARGPELMVSRADRLNVWRLDPESGLPQRVESGSLVAVDSDFGQLQGMAKEQDYDLAFLAVDGNSLLQIAAAPIDEAAVRRFPDGSRLLDQLSEQGYAFTGFLYRAAEPGSALSPGDLPNAAGSIAVNLEKDGQPWHTYFYCSPGKALDYIDGSDWGSEGELWIATFEGSASERLDVGLETAETLLR